MTPSPDPQADRGGRRGGLGRESELRVRSYVWLHRFNEQVKARHASRGP